MDGERRACRNCCIVIDCSGDIGREWVVVVGADVEITACEEVGRILNRYLIENWCSGRCTCLRRSPRDLVSAVCEGLGRTD